MNEVEHRGREGQGSDPSVACACLDRLIEAAYELNSVWDPVLDGGGYPAGLPSFDELLIPLCEWRDQVKERLEVEKDEDVRPVNFADPTEVREWLKQVRAQVEDAVTAGEDATRPPSKRGLGRPTARRMVKEARQVLEVLLRAAERGLD